MEFQISKLRTGTRTKTASASVTLPFLQYPQSIDDHTKHHLKDLPCSFHLPYSSIPINHHSPCHHILQLMGNLIKQPPSSDNIPIPSKPTNHLAPTHLRFPLHLLKYKRSRFRVSISQVPTDHGIPSHNISLRHCVKQIACIPNDAAFGVCGKQRGSNEHVAL
ncbi:hypothetical protein CR513_37100, partial [Mucuna pruriens]